MCSIGTDVEEDSIAFSTGMTCMPMPPPPIGTMGVMPSSGICVIRLKKVAIFGCSSISLSFITMNSAMPGTKIGTSYQSSFFGFSRFVSMQPTHIRCCSISSICFSENDGFFLTSCSWL